MGRKNKHKNKPKNKGRKEVPRDIQDDTSRTPATVQNVEDQSTEDAQNNGYIKQPANPQQPVGTQKPVEAEAELPVDIQQPVNIQQQVDIQQPVEVQRSVKSMRIKLRGMGLTATPSLGNSGEPLKTPFVVDDETIAATRKVVDAHIAATQQGLDPSEVRRAVERITTSPSKSQGTATTGSDSPKTSGAPKKDPKAFAEYIVEPDPVSNTVAQETLSRSDEALESLEKALRGAKDTNRKMQEVIQTMRATSNEIDHSISLFTASYGQRIDELDRKIEELNATNLQDNNTESHHAESPHAESNGDTSQGLEKTDSSNTESNSDTGQGLEKTDNGSNTPVDGARSFIPLTHSLESLRDATGQVWWQYGTATLPRTVRLSGKSKTGILNYKLFMCLIRRLKYSIPYDQTDREQAQEGTNARKGIKIELDIQRGLPNQGRRGAGTSV